MASQADNLIRLKISKDRLGKRHLKISHAVDCKTAEQLEVYIKGRKPAKEPKNDLFNPSP